MLAVDLHTHTLFSQCGVHTHLEVLERARSLGIQGVAITDHGPALQGRVSGPFFDRLRDPVEGVRLLKGMECNLVGEDGEIDVPPPYLRFLDVVLLGIHYNTPSGLGSEIYTARLIAALARNPAVDILTHLNDPSYPVDFEAVARAALATGAAIELNNSKTALQRSPDELTRKLVRVVKEIGCRLVVTSDMHGINELGGDDAVRPLLTEVGVPAGQILSRSAEAVYAFLDERRHHKRG
ncbi:MAG: PHP domain-containing protein [Polyangiaceae bacterium]|nr:PHP domain-containing protein [Polyangiaceae bacterium]